MSTEKGSKTQNLIAKIALRLFLQDGYDTVSLNKVALEADLSKGALTYHYRSKHELLEGVIRYFFGEIERKRQERQKPASFEEFVRYQLDRVLTINEQLAEITGAKDRKLNYHQLFFDAQKYLGEFDLVEIFFRPSIKKVEQFLKNYQQQGDLRDDVDPALLAFHLLTITEGSYIVLFYENEETVIQRVRQLGDDLIRRYGS